ncbi:MAG: NAD-dependent epimerase/dehydratase family protein [Actinomycetota bacterium]|nr:NAD-dependent epimerase/dehydratase family protein [Actinomycetota bacterium]
MAEQLLRGRRVTVTGGAGFIGSHLVERALADGAASVTVIDDLSTGSLDNLASCRQDVAIHRGDLLDPRVAPALADADLVFHLAVRNVRHSIKQPAENLRVNADGTLAALEALRTAGGGGRFVYVSSSEVYGIPPSGRYAEDVLPAPTTVYGAGKLAGELIAQAYHRTYGMDTLVVRPFNNFGPRSHFEGDSGEVIPKYILRALAGRPLLVHGDGTQTRDFMYVEDTARWLVQLSLVKELTGEVINIGSGGETRILDLAHLVVDLTGSSSEIVHVDPRPGDLPRLLADTAKVRALTGFELSVGLEEGLKRTIDSFADQDVERLLSREVERNWT